MGKRDFKKLKIFLAFVFLLLLPLLCFDIAQAQWENAVVQRVTFDTLPDQSPLLFIDENDKLHLFYEHGTRVWPQPWNYYVLYRTKEKGQPWSQPDTLRYFGLYDDYRLVYDWHYDIIHLAYHPGLSPDSTGLYYTNSSMNWQPVLAESIGFGYLSMRIDSSGNAHLSSNYEYAVDTTGYKFYKVMYATNMTGEWIQQEVSPPIELGYQGSAPSPLSVERNGVAHILYQEWGFFCHTYNNIPGGTLWHTDTVDASQRGYPQYPWHFIVDGDGHMHLLTERVVGYYVDSSYVYYSYRPSVAEPWGEPEMIAQPMAHPNCMYIDREKNVHITWSLRDHIIVLGMIYYATKKNGSWESIKILENEPYYEAVLDFTFVIDSEGKGHGVFSSCWGSPLNDSIREIYYLGEENVIWVDTISSEKDFRFELSQNYPNPFNTLTTIPFTVYGSKSIVHSPIPTTLKIYNILGEEVRTLVDEKKKPGEYKVIWDGKDKKRKEVSSGIYFYILKCGQYKQTKKMILIK